MNENRKVMVPAQLIRNLIYLWIAVINIGVDFGLLINGRWNNGKIILIFLMALAVIFSMYWTNRIINLFRELQTDAENQLI